MRAMDKTIVITGASAGIGAALARQLGSTGHRLVLGARRGDRLAEVAKACGDAIAVVGDVTRRADVEKLRDVALERHGRIDVWVNNAGRGIGRSVLALTDDDVDQIIAVNLKSAIYGMQVATRVMQAQGEGQIINISTVLARVPFVPIRSIYSGAKAALNMLTTNLRMELRRTYPKIVVTLVSPGVVLTDFHDDALYGTPGFEPRAAGVNAQTAEEVAAKIAAVIVEPANDVYTNPMSANFVKKFYDDPGSF
jgi:NADP-dependent 3-hydroxy acid dehydrogenase YdfG